MMYQPRVMIAGVHGLCAFWKLFCGTPCSRLLMLSMVDELLLPPFHVIRMCEVPSKARFKSA